MMMLPQWSTCWLSSFKMPITIPLPRNPTRSQNLWSGSERAVSIHTYVAEVQTDMALSVVVAYRSLFLHTHRRTLALHLQATQTSGHFRLLTTSSQTRCPTNDNASLQAYQRAQASRSTIHQHLATCCYTFSSGK